MIWSSPLAAGRWQQLTVIALLALLGAAFVASHLWWEQHDGLGFTGPDITSFLANAQIAHDWCRDYLQGVLARAQGLQPIGTPPFPPTGSYPPGAFLVSGFATVLFGMRVLVVRTAQAFFVAGLIALMGRLGWMVAGRRGALVLGMGVATSVWTSEFTRTYCMAPGQMFIAALLWVLVLESEGLTRFRICWGAGLAFGLGMLIKHTVLLLAVPAILVAGLPRLFSSRSSTLGFLLLLVLVGEIILATWWGMQGRLVYGHPYGKLNPWPGAMIPVMYLTMILASLVCWRRGLWSAGFGALLVGSVGGLACAPWYFNLMMFWEGLMRERIELAPVLAPGGPLLRNLTDILTNGAVVLDSFYWGGLVLLAVGAVMLMVWSPKLKGGFYLLSVCVLTILIHLLVFRSYLRYMAPLTPALVVVAFLWTARWRWSFVAAIGFMLLAGLLQMAGWAPAVRDSASTWGLRLWDIQEALPSQKPRIDLAQVPVAKPPTWTPCLPEAIPLGATVGLYRGAPQASIQEIDFLLGFISRRATVVEVNSTGVGPHVDLDYLLQISWHTPPIPPAGLRPGPTELEGRIQMIDKFLYYVLSRRPAWFEPPNGGNQSPDVSPPSSAPPPTVVGPGEAESSPPP